MTSFILEWSIAVQAPEIPHLPLHSSKVVSTHVSGTHPRKKNPLATGTQKARIPFMSFFRLPADCCTQVCYFGLWHVTFLDWWYCWWFRIFGWKPPFGCIKPVVNNGIAYLSTCYLWNPMTKWVDSPNINWWVYRIPSINKTIASPKSHGNLRCPPNATPPQEIRPH